MKNLKSLLLIASLVPALQGVAQIEEYTLPDGKVVKIDRSVFPDLKYDAVPKGKPADYVARRKRGRKAKAQLPSFVYNGQDKYFPPIFNQDGGSCGSAAGVGYQFTHEINSYRDADASLPENQYPSHFTWLMAYQTSTTEGMAKGNGIPNVPTYGGRTYSRLFGAQPPRAGRNLRSGSSTIAATRRCTAAVWPASEWLPTALGLPSPTARPTRRLEW